ncbi:MAG TPA: YtcA family lipoprotein [Acidobacteriaceae bacterium]|nr:YtcA family lipoprotein [Acidobacteriaceae bacterium]
MNLDRTLETPRRRRALPPFLALGSLGAAGCGRAPSFNIFGSFFPAWLLCILAGVVLAAAANWLLARYKLDKEIVWTILVYPCLAALFAFTLWLVFFS